MYAREDGDMDGLVDGEMAFEDGDSDARESDITSRRSGFMRSICKVAIRPASRHADRLKIYRKGPTRFLLASRAS